MFFTTLLLLGTMLLACERVQEKGKSPRHHSFDSKNSVPSLGNKKQNLARRLSEEITQMSAHQSENKQNAVVQQIQGNSLRAKACSGGKKAPLGLSS